jgi:coenzyme Q-binding protein COQ10
MPKTHIIRRIQNAPEDLFDIVSDVENYPEFINLISALRITKKLSEQEFEAEAVVVYKMISETFRSLVLTDRDALRISVKKAEKGGAVKSLLNSWAFHPLEDGSTLVDVVIDVRLKAMPLEFLLRDKFEKASSHIVGVFEIRAGQQLPKVGDDDYDYTKEAAALGLDVIKPA